MGRPSLRWLEDAHKDLAVIKFPRRRQEADDREEWTSIGSQRVVEQRRT